MIFRRPDICLVLSKGGGGVDWTSGNKGSSLSCRHSHGSFDVEQLPGSFSASFRSWGLSKRMSYLATGNSKTNTEFLISLPPSLRLTPSYPFPSNPEPGGNIPLDLSPQPDSILEASLVFPFTYAPFLACPESPDLSCFIRRWHQLLKHTWEGGTGVRPLSGL